MKVESRTINGIPVKVVSYGEAATKSAVVMIQEWWGITTQLETQAKYVSEKLGTTVVLPDLYDGKSTLDQEEANHLMSNLNWPGAVEKLGTVGRHFKAEGCEKIGIMGFCMGGALTVAASTNIGSEAFACGSAFYGCPPVELADPSSCTIPQQGHFGGKDTLQGFSDPGAAEKLKSAWTKAGIEFEMFSYPNVGHAFMNDLPDSVARKKELGQIGDGVDDAKHDPESIKLAWERTFAFFKKHGI
mmetsp:Transcript_17621/g.21349  ORF Transcript_17621/g.21349 Transcript_17621/m.21349 type:complete len:244 (-) Transcript_17621:197-928(-)